MRNYCRHYTKCGRGTCVQYGQPLYVLSIPDQFVPVCMSDLSVCVSGRWYSMSAAGSTQAAAAAAAEREREREKENEREETSAQEREAKRGTSTGSLFTGAELLQSESPYRKKAGSS